MCKYEKLFVITYISNTAEYILLCSKSYSNQWVFHFSHFESFESTVGF